MGKNVTSFKTKQNRQTDRQTDSDTDWDLFSG